MLLCLYPPAGLCLYSPLPRGPDAAMPLYIRMLPLRPDAPMPLCPCVLGQAELDWFREREEAIGSDLVADGAGSTQALMSRIGTMYTDFVRRTWLPSTVARLSLELRKVDAEDRGLGVPPAPGPGGDGSAGDAAALRASACAAVAALVAPCRAAAMGDFVSRVLQPLEQQLAAALATATVPLCDAQAHLRRVRQTVMDLCRTPSDALAEAWRSRTRAALQDDAPPFRLQRFPGLVARVSEWLDAQAPRLGDPGAAAEPYVRRLIDIGTGAADVQCSLDPDRPTATIRFNAAVVTAAVLSTVAGCYEAPGGTDEQLQDVVEAVTREREACHVQRVALQERQARLEDSVRRLLHLADIVAEAEPQTIDSTTPLPVLVERVLPELPQALQQVHALPGQCYAPFGSPAPISMGLRRPPVPPPPFSKLQPC